MHSLSVLFVALASASAPARPVPGGWLVDLGGHRLHVHCVGQGRPTVVIETGFDEFSFDWVLVESRLAGVARTCAYDRAGYAWSEPGPKPRTLDQINLELREALRRLDEPGPFVLVGHSFGGPVVRRFAETYPQEVAGVVLVDSAQEDQRSPIQGKAVRLRDSATHRPIPRPHLEMILADRPRAASMADAPPATALDPPLDRLPLTVQRMHLWAQSQPGLQDAENGERDWSPEYFALWSGAPQEGSLGDLPLVVLTRAEGGYGDDLDVRASDLDAERKSLQERLVRLSTHGRQILVHAGHDMHLEAPDTVATAITEVVRLVRERNGKAVKPK